MCHFCWDFERFCWGHEINKSTERILLREKVKNFHRDDFVDGQDLNVLAGAIFNNCWGIRVSVEEI